MIASPDCLEREQIFAYAHHMLSADEAARVENHLASCAGCREVAGGFEKLDAVLGEWKPVEPSPWFDARARARITAQAARPWRYLPHLGRRGWSAVAAAAVLAIVIGVAALRPPRSARSVPGAEATMAGARTSVKSPAAPTVAPASPGRSAGEQTPAANPSGEMANASTESAQAADGGTATVAQAQPASQEINLYKNLNVLENYDMLANFDVLSELPQAGGGSSD